MKKFILRIIICFFSLVVFFVVCLYTSSMIVSSRNFKNNETESNSLMLRSNKHFDFAFMGVSHARNFSRRSHHKILENKLHAEILNLGQGGGICGVNEQLFYLQYAYSKNIQIDTIIYVLSPILLYADYLNNASNTFDNEIFEFDFFVQYLRFKYTDNKSQRIFSYLKRKLHPLWLVSKPWALTDNTIQLMKLDSIAVKNGFRDAYKNGINDSLVAKNSKIIERTILMAQKHNSKIIFMIPPALFGKWPGHDKVIDLCKRINVKYFDFSESILEPKYYYDHHHLNTAGIIYFTDNYLVKILNE